jgi:hypothetical protein
MSYPVVLNQTYGQALQAAYNHETVPVPIQELDKNVRIKLKAIASDVTEIDKKIKMLGYEEGAVVYGGVLRDTISGKPISDWDYFVDLLSNPTFLRHFRGSSDAKKAELVKDAIVEIGREVFDRKVELKTGGPYYQEVGGYFGPQQEVDWYLSLKEEDQHGRILDIRFGSLREMDEVLMRRHVGYLLRPRDRRELAKIVSQKSTDTVSSFAMAANGQLWADRRALDHLSRQLFVSRLSESDVLTSAQNERFSRLKIKYPHLSLFP